MRSSEDATCTTPLQRRLRPGPRRPVPRVGKYGAVPYGTDGSSLRPQALGRDPDRHFAGAEGFIE
ncbi:hypothetical protein KNE206_08640 [Kitasatospora sp. NE20-6]